MWDDYDTPIDNPEKKHRLLMRLFRQCMELFYTNTEVVNTRNNNKASYTDAWKKLWKGMDKSCLDQKNSCLS